MRGHTSSYYIDVALMLIGAILIGFGEYITGIILLAIGAGIHFMMGD